MRLGEFLNYAEQSGVEAENHTIHLRTGNIAARFHTGAAPDS